jgi:hypothetical protein
MMDVLVNDLEGRTMRGRTKRLLLAIAAVLAPTSAAVAADTDRVVWKGVYTAPYHVAAECLARKMSGDFDTSAVMQDRPRSVRVGFWHNEFRRDQPAALFLIQPSGDDFVEIGWRRVPQLPDAARLDEAARHAAIECGGRSA